MNTVVSPSVQLETLQGEIQFLKLEQLSPSELNVRKSSLADIDSLAGNIEQIGLQQNLIVVPLAKGKKKGQFGVIAGRRRFQALTQLASSQLETTQKLLGAIPCKVISADDAILVSLSENLQRQQMTPVDTFNAVKALLDLDKSLLYISQTLGKSEQTIKQYIALANLSPKLIALFQEDQITLEQMQALTFGQTHEQQEEVWEQYGGEDADPDDLKGAILGDGVTAFSNSPLYQFVGLESYENRGGVYSQDLFGDDVFVQNHALMLQLFEEKSTPTLDEVKAQGWSWVRLLPSYDWRTISECQAIDPLTKPKSQAQEALYAKLNKEYEELEAKQEALEDPYGDDEEVHDQLQERLDAIQEQLDQIDSDCEYYSAEVMALTGGFVYLDKGQLHTRMGYAKKENIAELKKVLQSSKETANGADELITPKAEKPKSAHSESLIRRLYAEKTIALQWEVVSNQAVALATLAYPLVKQFFYERSSNSGFPLELTIRSSKNALKQASPQIEKSSAYHELSKLHDSWAKRLPKKDKDLFAHLQTLEPMDILALLSFCAVQGINGLSGTESADPLKDLAKAVSLDMTKYWKVTADSYLSSVSLAQISVVAKEAGRKDLVAQIESKKKSEAVAIAEKALADTQWLPKVLRS